MKLPQKSLALSLPKDIKLQSILPRLEEEKTRSFITLSLTLGAIIIFGFFAISPTLSTITQLNKQLDDDKFVDDSLVEKIANLSKLQEQYTTLQSDFSYVYSAIPKETEIPIFIAQIQEIIQHSQLQLIRVETLPVEVSATTTTKYTSLGVGIDINGQLPDTHAFIKELAAFQRIFTIDSISISQNATKGLGNTTVHTTIKGKIYFQRG